MSNLIKTCPMPDCGSTLIGTGTSPCGVATVNCGHCGMSVSGKTNDVTGAIERWNSLAARAADISQKTDISDRLRKYGRSGDVNDGELLIGAAEEIDRDFAGIQTSKTSAENKEADLERATPERINAIILDRLASDAATTTQSVDYFAERFLRSIFKRPDLSSYGREAFIKAMIDGREDIILCFDDFKTIASLLVVDADVISRASGIMKLIDDYVDAELFDRSKARQARTKIRFALTSELDKTSN